MKKIILFSLAFIFTLNLHAELQYQNFGNGWAIGLNQNTPIDIDEDGSPDFHVNGFNNELGFVPIFGIGCFFSPDYELNNIGSRTLTIHEEGDIIDAILISTTDLIDSDRGSAYSATTSELVTGWNHMQDQYVGFFIMSSANFGWMKVAVDINNKKMIIKEIVYDDTPFQSVTVGYTGQEPSVSVDVPDSFQTNLSNPTSTIDRDDLPVQNATTSINELEKNITELLVTPNPASERVNIALNYIGEENLTVVVINSVGKEVYRNSNNIVPGETNVEISVSDWSNGIYFIQLQNEKGFKTERLSVNR